MTDTFPILLTGEILPTLHQEREALADKLADAGFVVQVNRFGSGNAKHSGRNGNGVGSLLIVRRLERCEVESVRDIWNNWGDDVLEVLPDDPKLWFPRV